MVAYSLCQVGVGEPGEDSFVALVELRIRRADHEPAGNLLDQRLLLVRGKSGSNLGEILDPGGDQRPARLHRFHAKGGEIGKAGY